MTVLFKDAVFHSGTSEEDSFSYMAVKDGRIAGTYRERPDGKFKEVSLGGKHVYPCLIDGHVHMLYTIAVMAMGFDICRITENGVFPDTLAGIEKEIRGFCEGKSKDSVIAANNYIQTAIDAGRLPNRRELDDWAGGRAIVIYSIDGHSTALSSAMLRKIGIDPETSDGILTGEENERNQGKLTDIIASQITLPVLADGIAKFQNTCAAYGISAVGALEGNGDSEKDSTTPLIMRLARHFDIDVRFYLQYMDVERAEKLSKMQKRRRIGGCGDWEMDGSVGSHSAAFAAPYKDSGEKKECYYSREFVGAKVLEADSKGFQIASHAIGGRAIDRIAEALNSTGSGTFHRIEHIEFIENGTLEKLQPEKYALMMQPGYAWIDAKYLHTYENYLNTEILGSMKLKTYLDRGMCLCASSDSPVQAMDPYLQMLGMRDFRIKEESLSAYEAFRAYTLNPARAMLEEEDRGSLEKGKFADFFTADRDLFKLSPEETVDFRPAATYYRGRKYKEKKGTVAELLAMMLSAPKKV